MSDKPKLRLDVETVRRIQEDVARINRLNLEEIDIYENDQKIELPEQVFDNWKFIGLSNMCFFELDFWKKGKK